MKRISKGLIAVGTATALAVSAVGIAAADELRNNVGGSGVTITVAPGGQIAVGYSLAATSTPAGDPAGCDASGGSERTTITVSSSSYGTAGSSTDFLKIQGQGSAAAKPASRDVSNCRRSAKFTFTVGTAAAGSYAIHAEASGGISGSQYVGLGDFTLKVVQGVAATSLVLAPASSSVTYGTATQTWTATLTSAGVGVGGKTIQFNVGGAQYSATTSSSGVATLVAPIGTLYDADPLAYTVDAAFAGDTSYSGSSATTGSLTVTKANQSTLSITSPTSGSYNDVLSIATSGGSGTGTTTYAASGACSLTAAGASTIKVTSGTGTCSLTASNPGDTNYNATSASSSFTVGKASQSALSITGPSSAAFGAPDTTITTSGGSGTGALSFDAGTSTGCSIVSGKLHVTNASGSCSLTATKAGDADFGSATTASSFPVSLTKATQTVSITGPSSGTYGQSYDIAYTAGAGTGGVTFDAGTSSACQVVGSQVRITAGEGTCDLVATQAADDNYGEATSAAFSVTPNKAAATISVTDLTATYDGTAHAVTASVNPSVSGLSVTYNGSATAPTRAGSYTVVASLSNGNYVADQVTKTLVISPKTLTGAITADSKEYDGKTSAVVYKVALTGVVPSDDVDLQPTDGAFETAGYGTHKTVTAHIALVGVDAANYELSSDTASTTADITKRELIGSITAHGKTYDGNTAATAAPATPALDRVVSGDTVTLVVGTATFDAADAGSRTVTAAISLGGADADNYALKYATASAPATISPLTLGASITAANKVYDGSASATVTPHLTGVLSGETVNASPVNPSFDSKDIGTGKTVTAGLQLDNANYALPATSFSTKADITARGLTGSFTAASKTYDGNRTAAVSAPTLSGVVVNEVVTLSITSAQFADKNVGTGKTVSAVTATIGGADAGNYVLDGVSSTTGDITALDVTGSFTSANKVYDGTTSASPTSRTVVGMVAGDDVQLTLTGATFADANVGTGKVVSAAGPALTGTDARNYNLTGVATTTADITPASLTITASSASVKKGDPVPSITPSYSGWVTGEGPSVVTVAPACSTTYTPTSPVGSYPSSCSGAVVPNYAPKYVDGAVTVTYGWHGFFAPVDVYNGDAAVGTASASTIFNRAKAGSAIPVKFDLSGDQGLNILVTGYPATLKVACPSTGTFDAVEELATTTSGLKYDATTNAPYGQYNYTWKTPTTLAGTCQRLQVKLVDGSSHYAFFQFTK